MHTYFFFPLHNDFGNRCKQYASKDEREDGKHEIWNNRTNPHRHSIYRTREIAFDEQKKRACDRQCLFPLETMKDASSKDHFAFRLAVCASYFYRDGVPSSPYAPRHLHTISHCLDRRDRRAHGWTAAHGRLFKIGSGVSLALNMLWKKKFACPIITGWAGTWRSAMEKTFFRRPRDIFVNGPACVY